MATYYKGTIQYDNGVKSHRLVWAEGVIEATAVLSKGIEQFNKDSVDIGSIARQRLLSVVVNNW